MVGRHQDLWRTVTHGVHQTAKQTAKGAIAVSLATLLLGIGLDSPVWAKGIKTSGQMSEVSPPATIRELGEFLEQYQPQVKILSPKANEVLSDRAVSVRFQVKDLPLFKNAALGLGPHLHVFLDNQPYQAVYDAAQVLVLPDVAPGTHTLRVFASRPWHESFKNDGAYAQVTFHVLAKTEDNTPDSAQPLLTYSRPQGAYGAEPILLDFYLANAPLHLVAQAKSDDAVKDWKIKVTINGQSLVLDRWAAMYLQGWQPGENLVQLQLIDEAGKTVNTPFNNTARTFTFDPNGSDTLAKLTRGELSVAQARGIVDLNYEPPAPEVKPEVELKATPEAAPTIEVIPKAPVIPSPIDKTPAPSPTPQPIEPTAPAKSVDQSATPMPTAPVVLPIVPEKTQRPVPKPTQPTKSEPNRGKPTAATTQPKQVAPTPSLAKPLTKIPIPLVERPITLEPAPIPYRIAPQIQPSTAPSSEPIKPPVGLQAPVSAPKSVESGSDIPKAQGNNRFKQLFDRLLTFGQSSPGSIEPTVAIPREITAPPLSPVKISPAKIKVTEPKAVTPLPAIVTPEKPEVMPASPIEAAPAGKINNWFQTLLARLRKSDVAKPAVIEPEVSKPEVAKPQATKSQATKSQATKPELVKLKVVKPEVSKPEIELQPRDRIKELLGKFSQPAIVKPVEPSAATSSQIPEAKAAPAADVKPLIAQPIPLKPVPVKPLDLKPVTLKPVEVKPVPAKSPEAKSPEAKSLVVKPEVSPLTKAPAQTSAQNDAQKSRSTDRARTPKPQSAPVIPKVASPEAQKAVTPEPALKPTLKPEPTPKADTPENSMQTLIDRLTSTQDTPTPELLQPEPPKNVSTPDKTAK